MSKNILFIIIIGLAIIGGILFYGINREKNALHEAEEHVGEIEHDVTTFDDFEEAERIINDRVEKINNVKEKYMENPIVTLKTNKGDISLEIYLDKTPTTAGNFISLAEEGFYNNTKFHRVIEGFMIQGGDPNSKEDDTSAYGMGGPGYMIDDEFSDELMNTTGTISMANSGPNTGGSQFFINTTDNEHLNNKHAVFGHVVEGMDIVRAIETTSTDARDLPTDPVIILSTEVSSQ